MVIVLSGIRFFVTCHFITWTIEILNTVNRSKLEIVWRALLEVEVAHMYIFFSIAFVHSSSFPHCIWANGLCFSHGSFEESVIHFTTSLEPDFGKNPVGIRGSGQHCQEHPQAVTQVIGLIYYCLQSKLDAMGQHTSCLSFFATGTILRSRIWHQKRVNCDTTDFAAKQRKWNYLLTKAEIQVGLKCFGGGDVLVIVVVVVVRGGGCGVGGGCGHM